MQLLDLHLGRPVHRGALTLFPIWNGAAVSARGYDFGGETVQVSEHEDSAVVAELMVRNTGARPALLLDGELLEGGQQHRTAARSVLVPAQGSMVLDVRCVEEGRWHGTRRHERSGRRASATIRAARSQGDAWSQVRRFEELHGGNDTHSFFAVSDQVAPRAANLVDDLRPLPFQAGLLVGLAGQPLLLEVLDSPRTFALCWDQLLRSVAVDALGQHEVATPGRRARRFLDRATDVDLTGRSAGLATGLQGRTPFAGLDALLWRDRAVHAVATNPRHELVAA